MSPSGSELNDVFNFNNPAVLKHAAIFFTDMKHEYDLPDNLCTKEDQTGERAFQRV